MKLQDTSSDLHDFGRWLFQFMKDVAGGDAGEPLYQESGGWYRAPAKGKACLYVYFASKRKNSKFPNTAHLATLWDDELKSIPGVEQGNNWFGSTSADLYLSPDDPDAKAKAERFIRRAFKVVVVDLYLKAQAEQASTTKDPPARVGREELADKVSKITENTPDAPEAANWLRKKLAGLGNAAGVAVREILVNVASEGVKKAMWGG